MFTAPGALPNWKYNNIRKMQPTKTHSRNPRPEPQAYITLDIYYIQIWGKSHLHNYNFTNVHTDARAYTHTHHHHHHHHHQHHHQRKKHWHHQDQDWEGFQLQSMQCGNVLIRHIIHRFPIMWTVRLYIFIYNIMHRTSFYWVAFAT